VPRANPSDSFDCAVRHLFRHFDDPLLLRRNPLVSHLFGAGRISYTQQQEGLRELWRLVRSAVEHCRSVDTTDRNEERADRQMTLFQRYYFEKLPQQRVARDLGISLRQFYRERAEICRRIAVFIQADGAERPERLACWLLS
jgi:hypothetical protein